MDKLNLVQITAQKLASDKHFMAYYLAQSALLNQRSQAETLRLLQCGSEDYYKLALCQVPDPRQNDYTDRLIQIAAYSQTSFSALNSLIREIAPAHHTIATDGSLPSFIEKAYSLIRKAGRLLPLSTRMKTPPAGAYRLGFLAFSLIFLGWTVTASVETNYTRFYNGDYSVYKDSVKTLCVCDNTFVREHF